jgi:hypothetical protein
LFASKERDDFPVSKLASLKGRIIEASIE